LAINFHGEIPLPRTNVELYERLAFLSASEQFYSLYSLPVEGLGGWDAKLRLGEFLHAARHVESRILAVLVNRSGDEFAIHVVEEGPV
jgi:hypothetical protein